MEKLNTILIICITLSFSVSTGINFHSQHLMNNISDTHQEQILDHLVFIEQQNNMLAWNEICEGENCQSMLERERILDNLSTKLYGRIAKRWEEIINLEKEIKSLNRFSSSLFILGFIFSILAIILNNKRTRLNKTQIKKTFSNKSGNSPANLKNQNI